MPDSPWLPKFLQRKADDHSDTLKVQIGIEVASSRVAIEFSEPVSSFRMDVDRARTIAHALLRVCEAIEKPAGSTPQ